MNDARYRCGAVQEPVVSLLPVLEATLSRLRQMYSERQIRPGAVDRICIRPGWIAVTGTTMECGIAPYYGDVPGRGPDTPAQVLKQVQSLVGMPLLVLPDLKLSLNAVLDSSIKLAVLCALSQPFLGCPSIRKTGWQAECWRAGDPFIQDNPVLSRLIRPDDIVAVAGPHTGCRGLWEICRELHMLTPDPATEPETFEVSANVSAGPTRIHRHSFEDQQEVLGNADVVLLPSSTLVNGTFERFLGYAKNARLTGLVGTGASLVPDAFFSRGIDFIQSCRTVDTRRFIDTFMNDPDPVPGLCNFQKEYLFARQDRGSSPRLCPR
jgi:hypothetical protein